jgi:two-component system, chemotaxis family, sensor kinase Cph1
MMAEECPKGQLRLSDGHDLSQDLVDLIHDAALAYDISGTIIFWNHAAEITYGWTNDEIIGAPLSKILNDQSHATPDIATLSAAIWEGEVHHRHRNGSLLILQSRQIMQFDENGKPHHVLSINRDLTPTRTLEMQVKAHTLELERSNAELESFARIASHDLREPLRMIGSYSKLLSRRYRDRLDDDGVEFLDYVIGGAERMSEMIRDLLNVARIGSEPVEMQPVDLNNLVPAVLKDLDVLINESDGRVMLSELPTVQADQSQLRRVFQNLIENALKHRGTARPRITIDAERLLNIWRIAVRDNSPGIDSQDLNRIFVPYARGRNSGDIVGTGTGLAVTRKIIQGHGGRIWVDSTPGKGATFYLTLPVTDEENRRVPRPVGNVRSRSLSLKTIRPTPGW